MRLHSSISLVFFLSVNKSAFEVKKAKDACVCVREIERERESEREREREEKGGEKR